uniref:SMK-1 domain-containing protein n=1 Tax=Rhabditophanes sp. KR3021 TaxID=114890 RepID=A0AC35TNZ8_9BILA
MTEEEINYLVPESIPDLETAEIDKSQYTRVKLYVLCEQKIWMDKGTGHVAIISLPQDQETSYIVVRLEMEEKNVLQRKIQKEANYEKQQDTLVVWAEGESTNLALSFQEKDGCEKIWSSIIKAQGKDPVEVEAEQKLIEAREKETLNSSSCNGSAILSTDEVDLPKIDLRSIEEFEAMLASAVNAPVHREKMALAIEESKYVKQICDLFKIAEDLEHVEKLPVFGKIVRSLFLLNRRPILIEMFDDENMNSVVGMFEFDDVTGETKKHRDFLWNVAKRNEILPINSEEIKKLIFRSYVLQYVLDVCMPPPSLFDDNLTFAAGKYQLYIRVKIVCSLVEDKDLMKELFERLQDPNTPEEQRCDLVNFLKEFCACARALPDYLSQTTAGCDFPPRGKEQFFTALIEHNFFDCVPVCLASKVSSTRGIVMELLSLFLDSNSKIVRDFVAKDMEAKAKDRQHEMVINLIIKHVFYDRDPELAHASQSLNILKTLLDCPLSSHTFIPGFYVHGMPMLCEPLLSNLRDDHIVTDNYYTANKMTLIINFFTFCVEQHGLGLVRTNPAFSNVIVRAACYVRSKHHWLCLTALKLLRKLVTHKNVTFHTLFKKHNLLDLIVDTFKENGGRYNLLNSAILEFFQNIVDNDYNTLIVLIAEKYWDVFSDVGYVKTFRILHQKYDKIMQKENGGSDTDSASSVVEPTPINVAIPAESLSWKREREMEVDDQWFDREVDEQINEQTDEMMLPTGDLLLPGSSGNGPSIGSSPPKFKSTIEDDDEALLASIFDTKSTKVVEEEEEEMTASIFGGNSVAPNNNIGKKSIVFSLNNDGGVVEEGEEKVVKINHLYNLYSNKTPLVDFEDSDEDEETSPDALAPKIDGKMEDKNPIESESISTVAEDPLPDSTTSNKLIPTTLNLSPQLLQQLSPPPEPNSQSEVQSENEDKQKEGEANVHNGLTTSFKMNSPVSKEMANGGVEYGEILKSPNEALKRRRSETRDDFLASFNGDEEGEEDVEPSHQSNGNDEDMSPVKKRFRLESPEVPQSEIDSHSSSPAATV